MKTLTIYPEAHGKYVCDDLAAPGTPVVGRGGSREHALRDYLRKNGVVVVDQAVDPRNGLNSAEKPRKASKRPDLTVKG